MATVWTCNDTTCARTFDTKTDVCPQCGGATRRVGDSPWRGWLGLFCGLFLVGMMGLVTLNLAPDLNETVRTGASDGFSGTAEQAQWVLYLFYTIIAFGLLATVNGVYMIAQGQQHRIFIILMIAMTVLLLYVVYQAMNALGA